MFNPCTAGNKDPGQNHSSDLHFQFAWCWSPYAQFTCIRCCCQQIERWMHCHVIHWKSKIKLIKLSLQILINTLTKRIMSFKLMKNVISFFMNNIYVAVVVSKQDYLIIRSHWRKQQELQICFANTPCTNDALGL